MCDTLGSGCGKSTIIYLIERFYNAQKGTIFVDKIDILKFDPQWLRDQIGLVSQVPFPLRDGATVHCKQTQTVRLCS